MFCAACGSKLIELPIGATVRCCTELDHWGYWAPVKPEINIPFQKYHKGLYLYLSKLWPVGKKAVRPNI